MLLVKTKIGPSKISGIGLFADEDIPEGTIVWKFVAGFDLRFTKEEMEKFPEIAGNFAHKYSYLSRVLVIMLSARTTPGSTAIQIIPIREGWNWTERSGKAATSQFAT